VDGIVSGHHGGLVLSFSPHSTPPRLWHLHPSTVKSDMAIVTLATSLSTIENEYFTISFSTPGNRLAVPLTSALSFPSSCLSADINLIYATGVCSPPYLDELLTYDGYYSPGVCFSGYSIGCIATATIVNFEPVKPSETVAFCVPW
jgi:hypothetical protein